MIYLLAAVTIDAAGQAAASPWVEPVLGGMVAAIIGLIGWLGREALKKAAATAVAAEKQEQSTKASAALQKQVEDLSKALADRERSCVACHKIVDERFARGDTAIELLRKDMKHVLAAINEIHGMLLNFLEDERNRQSNQGGFQEVDPRSPVKRQRTDPRLVLPSVEEPGDNGSSND